MKIGLIVPGFAGDARDWCIPALTNLARSMAAQPGVDLHIFTLRYPHRVGQYRLHGASIHAFGGAAVCGWRLRGISAGLLWSGALGALRREAAHGPFSVLHGFWATESGYLAALAGRLLDVPAFVHLAGGELTWDPAIGYGDARPGIPRLLVALALRLATGITVPSGPMAALLATRYPGYMAKAKRWAFGVDTTLFSPRPATLPGMPAPLRLIHVASLIPVKDQTLLIAGLAAARAGKPERAPTLTVAGRGPLVWWLRDEARRLGVADVVHFVGGRDHGTLPELYRAHDAFVLSSRHEAQGMALLEAGACGLPWIGPPVGALADLAVGRPLSGWRVAAGDAAALGRAMLEAADPAVRAERSAAVRSQVANQYALTARTVRLLELYAAVAGRPPASC